MERWFQYPINKIFTVANSVASVQQLISSDLNFVCTKIMELSTTQDYQLRITQGTRLWQNNPVYASATLGTAKFPNVLLAPIVFMRNSMVKFEFTNGATASNVIQIVLEGYLTDDDNLAKTLLQKRWFQYASDVIPFTAISEQRFAELHIDAGGDFIVQKMTHFFSGVSADDYRVKISDANEVWTADYSYAKNIFGNAQQPSIIMKPVRIPANATVNLQVINGAVAVNNIQIVLEGYVEE